ncbi:MAG: aldehyde dehydrogenase family protein, partial [Rhizobiales bacterium]|nr:aldehyde dehydrogenase family protein [Hyphomicrobiales bacterium]
MDKPVIQVPNLIDPTLLKSQCYVDGAWVGEAVIEVSDPATGQVIGRVPRFGADETAKAVDAASAAFGPWAARTAKERSRLIRQWYERIMAHRDDLAMILTSEQGKPLAEALGEIDYAAAYIEFYAEEAKRIAGETLPSHRADARILVLRQPTGVVGAITPWNFPAAMITRKAAPALAAGCTMVLKPAGETPLTALALAELADRAGIQKGVFNVVTGDS